MQTILYTIVYILQIRFSMQDFRLEYLQRIKMQGKHLLLRALEE